MGAVERTGQAMLGDAIPETWDRMVRLYKACPKDSTTELCEAMLMVRTVTPDAPAQPGAVPPAPDGQVLGSSWPIPKYPLGASEGEERTPSAIAEPFYASAGG